jgi:hypothetical protein
MATQLANVVESAQAERLATGLVFTEGPKCLNRPHDIVTRSEESIYFTDPCGTGTRLQRRPPACP